MADTEVCEVRATCRFDGNLASEVHPKVWVTEQGWVVGPRRAEGRTSGMSGEGANFKVPASALAAADLLHHKLSKTHGGQG